jgi:23S rRNA pseudouridine2604 synthase
MQKKTYHPLLLLLLRRTQVRKFSLPVETPSPSSQVRINKCIPSLSRRAADEAVRNGRVAVNGLVIKASIFVSPMDVISLDGVPLDTYASIQKDTKHVYIKYNKPKGVTCTSSLIDPTNILAAIKADQFIPRRIFTVGRLDKDSTGLIVLTSDGSIATTSLSPSNDKHKKYIVTFTTIPSDNQLYELSNGVVITSLITRPSWSEVIAFKTKSCEVQRLKDISDKRINLQKSISIVLNEGKNRQIRKMAAKVGLDIERLHRISFCDIELGELPSGQWCHLTEEEINTLRCHS